MFDAAAGGRAVECSTLLASHLARSALTVIAAIDARYDPALVRAAISIAGDESD